MKKILILIFLICASFMMSEAYAQEPHCYNKKIRIKKVSKRRKGSLVGVKGIDDRKVLKKQMKERTKELKRKREEDKRAKRDSIKGQKEEKLDDKPLNKDIPVEDK